MALWIIEGILCSQAACIFKNGYIHTRCTFFWKSSGIQTTSRGCSLLPESYSSINTCHSFHGIPFPAWIPFMRGGWVVTVLWKRFILLILELQSRLNKNTLKLLKTLSLKCHWKLLITAWDLECLLSTYCQVQLEFFQSVSYSSTVWNTPFIAWGTILFIFHTHLKLPWEWLGEYALLMLL